MSSTSIEEPGPNNLLAIGSFSFVHLLEKTVVRKMPLSDNEEDAQPIICEATIYKMLGKHPRIAECLSMDRTDYIDIKYYPNGDLESYLRKNESSIAPGLREKWFQQILEAVDYLHEHGVMHSDLTLRRFLLDDDLNTRLGNFNTSKYVGYPSPAIEQASHRLLRDPEGLNTVASDLFALGSTLYELLYGKTSYSEFYPDRSDMFCIENEFNAWSELSREAQLTIEALFRQQAFADVSYAFGAEVIMGCWKGEFSSAKEALLRYTVLVKEL